MRVKWNRQLDGSLSRKDLEEDQSPDKGEAKPKEPSKIFRLFRKKKVRSIPDTECTPSEADEDDRASISSVVSQPVSEFFQRDRSQSLFSSFRLSFTSSKKKSKRTPVTSLFPEKVPEASRYSSPDLRREKFDGRFEHGNTSTSVKDSGFQSLRHLTLGESLKEDLYQDDDGHVFESSDRSQMSKSSPCMKLEATLPSLVQLPVEGSASLIQPQNARPRSVEYQSKFSQSKIPTYGKGHHRKEGSADRYPSKKVIDDQCQSGQAKLCKVKFVQLDPILSAPKEPICSTKYLNGNASSFIPEDVYKSKHNEVHQNVKTSKNVSFCQRPLSPEDVSCVPCIDDVLSKRKSLAHSAGDSNGFSADSLHSDTFPSTSHSVYSNGATCEVSSPTCDTNNKTASWPHKMDYNTAKTKLQVVLDKSSDYAFSEPTSNDGTCVKSVDAYSSYCDSVLDADLRETDGSLPTPSVHSIHESKVYKHGECVIYNSENSDNYDSTDSGSFETSTVIPLCDIINNETKKIEANQRDMVLNIEECFENGECEIPVFECKDKGPNASGDLQRKAHSNTFLPEFRLSETSNADISSQSLRNTTTANHSELSYNCEINGTETFLLEYMSFKKLPYFIKNNKFMFQKHEVRGAPFISGLTINDIPGILNSSIDLQYSENDNCIAKLKYLNEKGMGFNLHDDCSGIKKRSVLNSNSDIHHNKSCCFSFESYFDKFIAKKARLNLKPGESSGTDTLVCVWNIPSVNNLNSDIKFLSMLPVGLNFNSYNEKRCYEENLDFLDHLNCARGLFPRYIDDREKNQMVDEDQCPYASMRLSDQFVTLSASDLHTEEDESNDSSPCSVDIKPTDLLGDFSTLINADSIFQVPNVTTPDYGEAYSSAVCDFDVNDSIVNCDGILDQEGFESEVNSSDRYASCKQNISNGKYCLPKNLDANNVTKCDITSNGDRFTAFNCAAVDDFCDLNFVTVAVINSFEQNDEKNKCVTSDKFCTFEKHPEFYDVIEKTLNFDDEHSNFVNDTSNERSYGIVPFNDSLCENVIQIDSNNSFYGKSSEHYIQNEGEPICNSIGELPIKTAEDNLTTGEVVFNGVKDKIKMFENDVTEFVNESTELGHASPNDNEQSLSKIRNSFIPNLRARVSNPNKSLSPTKAKSLRQRNKHNTNSKMVRPSKLQNVSTSTVEEKNRHLNTNSCPVFTKFLSDEFTDGNNFSKQEEAPIILPEIPTLSKSEENLDLNYKPVKSVPELRNRRHSSTTLRVDTNFMTVSCKKEVISPFSTSSGSSLVFPSIVQSHKPSLNEELDPSLSTSTPHEGQRGLQERCASLPLVIGQVHGSRRNSLDKDASSRKSRIPRKQTGSRGGLTKQPPVRPPLWLSKADLSQEIQRLSSLCEVRTKELNRLKMETKHVSVGFDAFAALFKYMVEDLNALSVPMLSEDLQKTLKQLELAKQDLAYYEKEVEELKAHHCQELNDLSNKLFEVFQGEVTELSAKHQEEMNLLKRDNQIQIENLSITFDTTSEENLAKHETVVAKLQQELIIQREELQLFHQKELQDLEEKHSKSTKTLQEHIEQLQKKCAELKQHSMGMEDAMRKDTDTKLQWVTSRKGDLEKEVESLKAVLEMKNKELHTIRVQNLEMEKQLEELPLAREKIKMLQARAEDLEALMVEKTRLERKLSTENHQIKETFEKETKVNRRLSMENEELQWRLRQADKSLISGSFSEDNNGTLISVSEYPEEVENGTVSPIKSPAHMGRSVFFTFVDKDSSSPKSQYKKIMPGFSSNYKTSPAKSSPPIISPRRFKSHSEPLEPSVLTSTPRKVACKQPSPKQKKLKRMGSESSCRSTMEQSRGGSLSVPCGSMTSSVGSECSVFGQKENLLEDHKEEIMQSLENLRQQQIAEENMLLPTDNKVNEKLPSVINEDMSRSAEFSDPKTYYHMTFPVMKEGCETEDSSKVVSPENISTQLAHSNVDRQRHSRSREDVHEFDKKEKKNVEDRWRTL